MIPESFPQIIFSRPGVAEFGTGSFPPRQGGEGGDEPVIKTEYSIVSPGTEMAILGGTEKWAPLPYVPGYGSVGTIEGGPEHGRRVFTHGKHAKFARPQVVCVPLPEGMDARQAVFARMAAVSITALRVADAVLGDAVAVFGLGLVGNLAAQLFSLAGCEVIGIDPAARRREQAVACGIEHVLAPGDDLREKVLALTGGRMCRTVVEATGSPGVALQAGTLARQRGELILLGTPRGVLEANVVPLLNQAHSMETNLTIKGAHEWQFPLADHPQGHWRFSMEDNARTLLKLVAAGKLKVDPLLTHVADPTDFQTIYDGLRDQKDVYLGVVFDWSKV